MSLSNEAIIENLITLKDLDANLIQELMERILSGHMSHAQIAACLVLLRAKKETGHDIFEASQAILNKAVPIRRPNYIFADVVGTGGDGHNTINISTLASLTAASLGLPMAKHGSNSVSSKCGSSDVLQALKININFSPEKSISCLDKHNWCFLYAPIYHPAYMSVKPVRAELKIKTIFNILGPLVNPLDPPIMLIGVYEEKLLDLFASAIKNKGRKKALIVHGSGLDEIALHGPTKAILVDDKSLEKFSITPDQLGLKNHSIEEIKGGTPDESAHIFLSVLKGEANLAKISMVSASTGALLWLSEKSKNLKEGVKTAQEALYSQAPLKILKQITEF
jgi:anthranilate phosphoribosyltransferase